MFNFQGSELIIILLLALVVLGPEKLPDAMRKLGRFYGDLKKMSSGFQEEFRSAVDEPMRELRDTANTLRDSVDFRKLADGERDEKPKSAEMAPADAEAVPTDDVPFRSTDEQPGDTAPSQTAPGDTTPTDGSPSDASTDEQPGEPVTADPAVDEAPPGSGASDAEPGDEPGGSEAAQIPDRPAVPAPPPPFSSSQSFTAAPRPTNGDGVPDGPADEPTVATPSTGEPPLAPQVAIDDEHGLREARPADADPGRRDGVA